MWGISFSPSSDGILGPRSEFGTHIPITIFYIQLQQQLDVIMSIYLNYFIYSKHYQTFDILLIFIDNQWLISYRQCVFNDMNLTFCFNSRGFLMLDLKREARKDCWCEGANKVYICRRYHFYIFRMARVLFLLSQS